MQTPNAGLLTNVRNNNINSDYALNDTVQHNDSVISGQSQSLQRKKQKN